MECKMGGFETPAIIISIKFILVKRKKRKKDFINDAIYRFEKWYYRLSFGLRHVVGVLLLLTVFAGVFGITYGSYRLLRAGYTYAVMLWNKEWGLDDKDEYSPSTRTHFEFPLADNEKHPKRRPNYSADFNHMNDVQLRAAKKLGIQPQPNRESLLKQRGKLVELRDTRYYEILNLTNSSPYLVPKAADFLTALGRLMQEYNGTESRFYISSVLRTQEDVNRLGRVNGNASKNSTHCYGTTVDITYSRFDIHGRTTEGKLKEDLARALYDLQQKGYCYVKYEYKQPCFHVTVRP